MLVNTGEQINDPELDQVVFFQPWMGWNDKRKKPYPVIINNGCFLSGGAISNFWYWNRLTPTGRIKGEEEHGYGNFTRAEGYSVERKVVISK